MSFLVVANVLLAEGTEPVGVPGWIPVVIGVILLLLFWWGLSRNSIPQGIGADAAEHHDEVEPAADVAEHHDEVEKTAVSSKTAPIPVTETAAVPDNLRKIEGIGPKIEGILHDAAIRTFANLAAASVSQLEKIVREDAGIRIAFPDTWPEQAALAANGKWAELEDLQDNLKGGRHA
jgi:predicted flap endonuclease-1-like 5' DNA nuclease